MRAENRIATVTIQEEPSLPPPPERRNAAPPSLPPENIRPKIMIVLDDAGYSLEQLQVFLDLPIPLTIAILPFLPHSQTSLERILRAGKTAILHMPMEPMGAQNPGEGALMVGDTPEVIREKLARALDSLPGVIGLNNHMGSRFTSDLEGMKVVLEVARERGLVFLDSFTHADSKVSEAAEEVGLATLRRDVFADNEASIQVMSETLNHTLRIARLNNSAILIGHVWSPELAPLFSGFEDRYSSEIELAPLALETP